MTSKNLMAFYFDARALGDAWRWPLQSRAAVVIFLGTAFFILSSGFVDAQTLCPPAEEITPCVCHEGTAPFFADIDCSEIAYGDQLGEIFAKATFPFTKLRNFRCVGSTLESLPAGVFGDVTFQKINITDSLVRFIDGDVFLRMRDRLEQLIATRNRIHTFPFEVVSSLDWLSVLDLSYNHLPHVDRIVSETLSYVYLQGNEIASLADNTFTGATALFDLQIGSNLFTDLPIGFVDGLTFLHYLDISNGNIRELKPRSLAFQSRNVLQLWLNDQNIEIVDPMTFEHRTAFSHHKIKQLIHDYIYVDKIRLLMYNERHVELQSAEARLRLLASNIVNYHRPEVLRNTAVHLENNAITELKESAFGPILASFTETDTSAGFLYLDGNPLVCNCEMKWLAANPDYMKKISGKCEDGTPLSSLDPLLFEAMC